MKVCILMGSPRRNGNTASLLEPFAEEMKKHGAEIGIIDLYAKKINPCAACRRCQNVSGTFGCPQKDDMQTIFDSASYDIAGIPNWTILACWPFVTKAAVRTSWTIKKLNKPGCLLAGLSMVFRPPAEDRFDFFDVCGVGT